MDDDDLDVTQFDALYTSILGASKAAIVLDTGSSHFVPMVSYLYEPQRCMVIDVAGRHRIDLHECPQRRIEGQHKEYETCKRPQGKPGEAKYIQHGCLHRGHAAPGPSAY